MVEGKGNLRASRDLAEGIRNGTGKVIEEVAGEDIEEDEDFIDKSIGGD